MENNEKIPEEVPCYSDHETSPADEAIQNDIDNTLLEQFNENNSEVVDNPEIPPEAFNGGMMGGMGGMDPSALAGMFGGSDDKEDDPTEIPYKSLLAPATEIIINGELAAIKDIFQYDSNAKVTWYDTYGYDPDDIMIPAEVECHRIIDLALNNVDKILNITFSNGIELLCSKSTPIVSEKKEWVCALDYKVGNKVICVEYDDQAGMTETTAYITKIEELDVVADRKRRMVMYEFTSTMRNILIPKVQDNNKISFIVVSQ